MRVFVLGTLLIFAMPIGAQGASSTHDSQSVHENPIRRDGFSDTQLRKLQLKLVSVAYETNGKLFNPEAKPKKSKSEGLKTESTKDLNSRSVAEQDLAIRPEPEDVCDSFYMPPAKYRFSKKMPLVDPCAGRKTTILADTDLQVLFLCKDGKTIADYDFAMGTGGVGKKDFGDRKTPLGVYKLEGPRVSGEGFKTFIPIGYPTTEQVKRGYTGRAIGIHGPARIPSCWGFLNTIVNWTAGCLAVASDTQIKEIGRFVVENRVNEITILPLETKTLGNKKNN